MVKYRLNREGFHFFLILLFVLTAAVLRNVSLLIILAGIMTGLLLLQWRIACRTLLGLRIKRDLPTSMMAGQEVDVRIEIANTRRWLGSWLVVVEDRLARTLPVLENFPKAGSVIIDEIPPLSTRESKYSIRFNERGLYRVGGATVSSTFPLNIGCAHKEQDLTNEITIHPKLGVITPRCKELLQVERQGLSQAAPLSGLSEGEFYGLRPWHNGDSQRWIHWRTTARLGELAVRQFEQQQRMQVSLLLELYRPTKKLRLPNHAQSVEQAVSFVATLATELVGRGRHKLGVAIAASQFFASQSVQSRVLVGNLLDNLAVAQDVEFDHLEQGILSLSGCLVRNPLLLVVSTRENQLESLAKRLTDSHTKRLLSRLQVRWLNVVQGELEPYFQWTNPKSEDSAVR